MQLKFAFLLALASCSSAALANEVSFVSAEGASLAGNHWGKGARGVLLLHHEGRSSQDWSGVGPELAKSGAQALALNLPEPRAEDVTAGIAWLRDHGAREIHLVGAGSGALLALQSEDSDVAGLVLLSPPLRGAGSTLSLAAANLGPTPLLVAAARTDAVGARAARFLGNKSTGPHEVVLFDDTSASGARLLNAVPALQPLLLSWIQRTHPAVADAEVPSPTIRSEGVTTIETQGRRFGE